MPPNPIRLLSAVALAVVVPVLAPPMSTPAAAATDVTADVRANRNVVLAGDATVTLPAGTTTYTGVISGAGTLTVAGTGRLVLTRDSDFTLPKARQRQTVTTGTSGDSYAVTTISIPDPPAVIVKRGATLQYGPGEGAAGAIGHYPYQTPGPRLNGLNIRVDGTLDIAVHKKVNLGVVSGSGFIIQRRFTWDGLSLQGDQPFTGVIYNGTGVDLGSPYSLLKMPGVKKMVNQGSSIVGVPTGQRLVLSQDFYSREFGNDINFNFPLSKRAVAVMTGVYSWADSGPDSNPSLSDPALNFRVVAHRNNKRGVNIEGSNVQWGDGTHNRFFLPGNKDTVYINLHTHDGVRGRLTFDYNGPVTLSAPISGGIYHDTMTTPGAGDIVIAGTPGNAVTIAAPQNYDGSTTIGKGASLRLGTGTAGGDGSLLMRGDRCVVVNNGSLTVQNAKTAVTLSRISGDGSFTQAGAATTTLTGRISYTGDTTIASGTLALRGGASLASSRGVELTRAGAALDLTRAGRQTVKDLSGVTGTTVALGGSALTVGTGKSTVYAGAITGDDATVTKVAAGTLTLTGKSDAAWTIREGGVRLGDEAHLDAALGGPVTVTSGATLSGAGTVDGSLGNAGTVAAGWGAPLRVAGEYTQDAGATLELRGDAPGGHPRLSVAGSVTLAGRLSVTDGAVPADGTLTVLDNTNSAPVSGTFDGLAEGAALTVDGTELRISYAGGDGNDVVLTAGAAAGAGGALVGDVGSGGTATALLRWAVLGVLLLTFGLLLLLWLRRRAGQRRDGHRATATSATATSATATSATASGATATSALRRRARGGSAPAAAGGRRNGRSWRPRTGWRVEAA